MIQSFYYSGDLQQSLTAFVSDRSIELIRLFVLGDRSYAPKHLLELFFAIGTHHFLAISGFHFGLLKQILQKSLFFFTRKPAIFFLVVALIYYALLIGPSPSVVRASVMSVLGLISSFFYRKNNGLLNLFLAGLFIYFFFFDIFWSIGFQMSFLATFGLLVSLAQKRSSSSWSELFTNDTSLTDFSPDTKRGSDKKSSVMKFVIESYQVSAIIFFWVMPVGIYHFGGYQLAQLLVAPALTAIFSLYISLSFILFFLLGMFVFTISLLAFTSLFSISMLISQFLWLCGMAFDLVTEVFVYLLNFFQPLAIFYLEAFIDERHLFVWYFFLSLFYLKSWRQSNLQIRSLHKACTL